MKEQNRERAASRLFSRTRLSALGILAMAAMAQAVITAKVTISTYSAFASQNVGATPGMLIFPRASQNDYNEAAGTQWLTINGNGTYTTTLGAAGYYWTGFNDNNAYQVLNCTVTGLPPIYMSGTYLADGTTVNMTITCTEPDVTGPVFSSAAVSSTGTSLTITFNEDVAAESYATSSAFSVTAGGTAIGVSNVTYSGSTAVLTLSTPIASGKIVLVSYTGSGIYDDAYNNASTFTNKSVTNNSTLVAPTVTTGAASSVTSTTASLAGTVKANSSTTTDSVQYGTSIAYGTTVAATPATTTGTATTTISAGLSGLLPNTTYHYRVKAVNVAGTTYGADATFTTTAIAPTVTTRAASSITSTTVSLAGTVNANNSAATDSIQYGTSTAYGTTVAATPATATGTSATAISAGLSGLLPNTTYYYRIKAVNAAGATYGTASNFTTAAIAPTVTTGAASSVISTTVSLAGTVNANNSATTDSIQYGTSSTYGTTVAATPATATGTSATAISAGLSELLPGTTYHYRVKAVNAAGTTYGTDATFTTSKLAQSISATTAYSGSYGDTVVLSATASSGLAVTWTSADPAAVKIVSSSKAVLGKTGKILIVASQVGNTSYDSAASAVCTLTVGRKSLNIVGMAASDKVYDGTTAAIVSGAKLDSVLAGDSVALALGTATFASKDVGTNIGVSFTSCALAGKDSASYQIRTASQPSLTASILTKTLLVKALDTAKIVGISDPVLAYTDTGLVTGDALTGALARAPGDTVGTYTIEQGTLTAGTNYALTFVPATFTIRSNPATAIEGNNPMRMRTLGTLGASAFRKLPAMASGPAAPTLGLNSAASEAQSLSLLLPSPATVSVSIFDLLGVPVISWNAKIDSMTWNGLQEAEGGRATTIFWNLRAENGTAVPAGVYLWKIKATTVDGQELETVKKMGVK